MHIAVITAYPPSRGTLNEYGYHLVEAFRQNSAVSRVSVIADRVPDAPRHKHVYRVWDFNDPQNSQSILRIVRALKPDVVLFNLQFATFGDKRVPAALGLMAPMLCRRAGFPTITLMHNLFETIDLHKAGFKLSRVQEFITRTAGRMFTRILLQSSLVATTMPRYVEILRGSYGAENVFLAPHGTFTQPPEPAPLPETPTIMTFGKFGTYKTVDHLIEAHQQLLTKNPDIQLVIAGSDSPNAKGYLQSMRDKYQGARNIHYTGYVAEEDVPKVFQGSTVVAFPYNSTTGSSGVLHQAGEFARGAVMPKIGDLKDLIEEEGYQAVYFEPENTESLRDALWEVLSDPEKARSLGLNNFRVASGLLLSDVAEWYILHFENLLRRSHGHS